MNKNQKKTDSNKYDNEKKSNLRNKSSVNSGNEQKNQEQNNEVIIQSNKNTLENKGNDENIEYQSQSKNNYILSKNIEQKNLVEYNNELQNLLESNSTNHKIQVISLLIQLYEKQKQTILLRMENDIYQILKLAQKKIEESGKELIDEEKEFILNAFFISSDNTEQGPDIESEWKSIVNFLKNNPNWAEEILKINKELGNNENKKQFLRNFLRKVKDTSREQLQCAPLSNIVLYQEKDLNERLNEESRIHGAEIISANESQSLDGDTTITKNCLFRGCLSQSIMSSNYCFRHILYDPKQKLYTKGRNEIDPRLRGEQLKFNSTFSYNLLDLDKEEWDLWNKFNDEREFKIYSDLDDMTENLSPLHKSIMFNISKIDKSQEENYDFDPEQKKRALNIISYFETTSVSKRARIEE